MGKPAPTPLLLQLTIQKTKDYDCRWLIHTPTPRTFAAAATSHKNANSDRRWYMDTCFKLFNSLNRTNLDSTARELVEQQQDANSDCRWYMDTPASSPSPATASVRHVAKGPYSGEQMILAFVVRALEDTVQVNFFLFSSIWSMSGVLFVWSPCAEGTRDLLHCV